MTTLLDLTSIIASATVQRELQPRNDLREPGWTFWELRTLNMHRVVGLLHEHREFLDAHDFEATIRRVVSRNFKTSWWRGMGYGIVAEVAVSSLRDNDLKVLVATRTAERNEEERVGVAIIRPGSRLQTRMVHLLRFRR